jgi:spore germination cell wall hydrolase CwlJ-like protein
LIENHRSSMTPEQLDDAIDGYIRDNPEWQAEADRLEQALADGGSTLLNHWNQIRAFASSMPANEHLAGHRETLLSRTAETAATPEITAAATAAMRNDPGLFQPNAGVSTLDTVDMLQSASNNARAANAIRKLGQEAVTFYMKHRIDNFVSADVSTPERANLARANLLQGMREGVVARLMGVSDKHYQMAVDALETAIPAPNETEPQKLQRLAEFDRKLDTIYQTNDGVKSFSRFTPPGQLMRVAGLALSGTTAVFSGVRAFDDPTLANGFKAAVDAVGMTQKFADFTLGLRGEQTKGWHKAVGGTPATRLFGALTAAADVGIAVQYIMRDDPGAAAWTGVTAAGGFTWALGTSAWSGPVGFGLVVVGALGLEAHRKHQEVTKYETPTSADFLDHSDLSREAADVLVDQSGEGHSPVPILMRYGELRGLTPQQTAGWINSIVGSEDGAAKLAALRDNLHHTLDEIDGDVSRFNATSPNDAERIWDTEQRPWFARTGVARPDSAAQLDAMLPILEIDKPVPPAPANPQGTGSPTGSNNNPGGGNNVTAPNNAVPSATTNPQPSANTTDTPGASPSVALSSSDRDHVIRTIWGEAASEPAAGQEAVAHVIRNRVVTGQWGDSATEVVLARSQFEPWNTAAGRERMQSLSPNSAQYQRIGAIVDRVFAGEAADITHGATHFYAPAAQAALGRDAPDWATNRLATIGGHEFYAPNGAVG